MFLLVLGMFIASTFAGGMSFLAGALWAIQKPTFAMLALLLSFTALGVAIFIVFDQLGFAS